MGRHPAGGDLLGDPETTPSRPFQVGGPDGIAIHQGFVERGEVDVGDDVLGEGQAKGVDQGGRSRG